MNRPFNELELEVEKGEGRSSHKPRESQLQTSRQADSSERPWGERECEGGGDVIVEGGSGGGGRHGGAASERTSGR